MRGSPIASLSLLYYPHSGQLLVLNSVNDQRKERHGDLGRMVKIRSTPGSVGATPCGHPLFPGSTGVSPVLPLPCQSPHTIILLSYPLRGVPRLVLRSFNEGGSITVGGRHRSLASLIIARIRYQNTTRFRFSVSEKRTYERYA